MSEIVLNGIPAAPGIAIGKAFILDKQDAERAGVLMALVDGYQGQGRHQEALERLEEHLRENPEAVEARFLQGVALAEIGDQEGWKIVGAIEGVQSGHFRSEDGPRCVNCPWPRHRLD